MGTHFDDGVQMSRTNQKATPEINFAVFNHTLESWSVNVIIRVKKLNIFHVLHKAPVD